MDEQDFYCRWQTEVLPVYEGLFNEMIGIAKAAEMPLYIIGGFIRDLMIGIPRKENIDLDVVVEGDAISYAASLQEKIGGRIQIHKRFGTATWFIGGLKESWKIDDDRFPDTLDIISARKECYKHPGALPRVKPGNIIDDIDRRDFSINTLAVRLEANRLKIIDRHNALQDIENGVIRILHERSFNDDPTRMFRAVRYEQRYQFSMDPETLQRLRDSLEYLKNVSGDRIRNEINAIIAEKRSVEALIRLDELGLLAAVQAESAFRMPQIQRVIRILQEIQDDHSGHASGTPDYRQKMIYAAWLTSFESHICQAFSIRLNLPASIKQIIDGYYRIYDRREVIVSGQPIDVTEFLETVPILSIRLASLLEEEPLFREVLHKYLLHWRFIHPVLKGHDLMQRGLPSGSVYSIILRRLRAARLNGIIHSHQSENDYLDEILAEMKKGGA